MKKDLIAEPIESKFGLIRPGERVLVSTMCSKRLHQYDGVYLGYVMRYPHSSLKNVVCSVIDTKTEYYWKDTGFPFCFRTDYNFKTYAADKIGHRQVQYSRTTTLQRNRIAPLR